MINSANRNTCLIVLLAAGCLVVYTSGCGKSAETESSPTAAAPDSPPAVQPVGGPPAEGSGRFSPVMAVPPVGDAVSVDGVKFSNADLEQQIKRAMASPRFARVPVPMREQATAQVRKELVNQFVSRQLLLKEASSQGIEVEAAEIDTELDRIRGTLPPGANLEEAIARAGITMERLNADIREGLRVRKVVDQHLADVPDASDEEIEAYYTENLAEFESDERVKARHILVRCDPSADDTVKSEKRKLAQLYRQQLLDGTNFAELAKSSSEGPSAPRGGDLGHFGRGQMVPPFDKAAFSQEIDAIGELVETQFGFHIVQVLDRHEAGQQALEEVRDDIAAKIEDVRKNALVDTLIKKLSENATVTYGS
jgi:peptidyl-prolyl cis-trans isomerase C